MNECNHLNNSENNTTLLSILEVGHVFVLGNIKIMFCEENNEFCLLWLLKSNGLNKTKQKTSKSLKHRRKKALRFVGGK